MCRGGVRFYMRAALMDGTADSGTVSGYALARVRLCTRRSTVAAHSTTLRRPRKCRYNKEQ